MMCLLQELFFSYSHFKNSTTEFNPIRASTSLNRWRRVANPSVRHSAGVCRRQQERDRRNQTVGAGLWPGRQKERDRLREEEEALSSSEDETTGVCFIKEIFHTHVLWLNLDQSRGWIQLFQQQSVSTDRYECYDASWLAGRDRWSHDVLKRGFCNNEWMFDKNWA